MSLTACHECKHEISDEAKQCPHCGARPRKKVGIFGMIFAGLLGLVVFQCTRIADHSSPTPAAPAQTDEQKAAAEKFAAADSRRFHAAKKAIRSLKGTLKDPESLKVETIGVSEDANIVCILFRAKNSFNATVPNGYVFDGDLGTDRADVIKKFCNAKKEKFFDMSEAK